MSFTPKEVFDSAPDELRSEVLGVVWVAIHEEARRANRSPDMLPTDISFTLAVARRMFHDLEVALAWRAARGPDWLEVE